ncbi:hypothetical protein GCM10007923_29800 [Shinella yambaruensis]|uniref:Uncharacterized protein n=1 Tax=Shinella yambaruensis TaxID=415996 RepID=A0ABQ5ZJJ8_9HYPH|nr:hypothetical protein GCM10007923_29800 [Shinella yambaruensis]
MAALCYRAPTYCRFHLLVGEDAMSCDALFQSGMGSVDAPRTEERFSTCAPAARSGFDAVAPTRPVRPAKTPCLPALFPTRHRERGNSAKALSYRRVRTTIP